jgi:hypothetical protein
MSTRRQSTQAPPYSRQWWLESAKISLWVILVTLLVWIYADMEFTVTDDVTMHIRLNTTSSADFVITSEPRSEVVFKLRGSRSDLDRFANKFRGTVLDFDLSTVPGFHAGPGQAIPSVLALESFTEVQSLRIVSGSPPAISDINIEKLELRELPVEFIFKGAELANAPSATVKVWAPPSRWSRILTSTPGRNPTIRTIEKDLTELPAGQEQEISFQLIPAIGSEPVKLDANSVTVSLQVVRRTASATETIPITVKIVTPAEWTEEGVWDKYKLVRKDRIEWLTKINVTGPRKDIDILKTDKTKTIDAYIVLTDSDTEPIDSWSDRKVTLRFPPDLQIQLASGQVEPTVRFRLEKRVATTP